MLREQSREADAGHVEEVLLGPSHRDLFQERTERTPML